MIHRLQTLLRRRVAGRLTVLVLSKDLAETPTAPAGLALAGFVEYHPAILELHREFGRGTTEDKIRRRFERGLRFWELRREGRALASLWTAGDGERFVDEIGLGFQVPPRALWLRDVFVEPRARRQGLFGALLDAVAAGAPGPVRAIWSDVGAQNEVSLRAHTSYGFALVARYSCLQLLGRLSLRLEWPTVPPHATSYEPERRFIHTGRAYRRFVAEHIA